MAINWYDTVTRLILAVIVGGVIGNEREQKNRPAGFRTHILVCLGAAVISLIEVYSSANIMTSDALGFDFGRFGAQVVTGVGFLGAGTIIHEKGSVKGLTTAASLWVVACIGLAVGLGYYFLSILSAIITFLSLFLLKAFEEKFIEKGDILKLCLNYRNKKKLIPALEEYFENNSVKIKNLEFSSDENDDGMMNFMSNYTLVIPKGMRKDKLIDDISMLEGITKVKVL